ncbi:hypothetical protein PNEG_02248 [Pneumocystis murina B123]|uniref:RRM domain-containing protein n=1 Tax=Pneumocystis murina (strain B123) TaxID=1069680 RepID=M7NQC7_PNEMU|nr:hypothetical protein PNEG_02248 [Pneumocystis murina B123]EMR09286.1 hypothetical protein PNEG_02248 [Pneumocystis murina B123]
MDEELIRLQQNAYSVEGVDETIPIDIRKKNRKRMDEKGKDEYLSSKKKNLGTSKNTAVYVSNLPPDVTEDEIKETFSKCGLISENIDTGKPRIKIYLNEQGEPKGDAVVVFFREESVKLAIQLLDDTYLRLEDRHGQKIKVQEADTSYKKSQNNPVKRSSNEKRKLQQKMKKLNNKISEWDDDTTTTSGRWSKVVILKHMFTLKELEEDITLIIDLKQDILEECSKIGNVTNIVLFDLEPDGVVSVRFSDEESALVCVKTMNGRYFGGKIVSAEIYDGKVRYRKSSNKNTDDADEQARLEKFGEWLKSGE